MKKIEQKPTLEDAAKAFLEALSETPYNNIPIVEAQIITKQLLIFLSDPKSYNPDAINEYKAAEWSEDDEKMCQETIDWFEKKCFPYALESENPARESIKWLKSLKQRIGG